MKSKIKIFHSVKKVFSTLWYSGPQLLLFSFIYQLMVTLILKPIIRLVFSLFLRLKGYPLLINGDIRQFFMSITGVFIAVILLTMISLTIYYEFSTILHILKLSQNRKKTPLIYSMEKAIFSLGSLGNKDSIGFILYSIVLLPLMNFGIQPTILPQLAIPNFIIDEVSKYTGGVVILPVVAILGVLLFIRLILVLPIMIFEKKTFFPAAKISFQTTKNNFFGVASIFTIVLALFIALMILPLVIFAGLRGVLFLPFKGLSLLLSFAIAAVFPAIMICGILVCYEHFSENFSVSTEDPQVDKLDSRLRELAKTSLQFIQKLWGKIKVLFKEHAPKWLIKRPLLIILFLIIPGILFIDFIIPLQFQQEKVLIIGHRGSLDGVENTIEAIEGAIVQGADYAEIDVQLSKDGVPMVIHDTNLSRLTGIRDVLYNYTAEELGTMVLKDREYTGKISTLDEICKITKGRIGLLIELKTHGYEEGNIVDDTVSVVKENNMTNEVMYQSTHLNLLTQMKIKYPSNKVGYIIYGYLGKLTTPKLLSLGVDFIGVEETFVNKNLIIASRRAGVPVFVWTVNLPGDISRFLELEVNAIITDYPRDAIKDIEEAANEAKEEGSISLPNLLQNNSFFSIMNLS